MRSYNHGRFQQQASFLCLQFLQDGNLPFTNVLSEGIISQALAAIDIRWLDRIYSPLVWPVEPLIGSTGPLSLSPSTAVKQSMAHRWDVKGMSDDRRLRHPTANSASDSFGLKPNGIVLELRTSSL
jgi:hypothetical protein